MADPSDSRLPTCPSACRASTTSWAAACPPTASTWSRATRAPARPRSRCSSCSKGVRRGEPVLYVTLSETARRAARRWPRRTAGRSTASASPSSPPPRRACSAGRREHDVPPVRGRARRDHRRGPATRSSATRPSRVVFDSLSEMRLLAQNPLRYRRQILALKQFFVGRDVHGAAARRPHRRPGRPAAAEHRARRDHARAAAAGVRRRAAPPAGRQDARQRVPRRLPRLRHPARRARRSSRAWSPPSTRRRSRRAPLSSGVPELDALLGGGLDRGTSTLLIGPGRLRQVDARRRSTPSRRRERGERAAIFLFDESVAHAPRRARRGSAWTSRRTSRPGASTSGRSTRPSCRPASSRSASADAVEDDGSAGRRHRQPQRLPERDAGGALPDAPAARAAHLPRPAAAW